MKKLPRMALTLLLLITLSGLSAGITIAGDLEAVRLLQGQLAPFDGTLYNEAADAEINKRLIGEEICFESLESEVNKRNTNRIIFSLGGLLIGYFVAK